MDYEAIVIGTSAGGIDALKTVLSQIEMPLSIPIIIVQHLSPRHKSYLPSIISQVTGHNAKEIDEKETLVSGWIYFAPPNFHILIEKNKTVTLTVEKRVSYARPSIDVLFETAADTYRDKLIGVILTGANHDGAKGIKCIDSYGGYTIVQSPDTAYADEMPKAAMGMIDPNEVLSLIDIGKHLNQLIKNNTSTSWENEYD